MYTRASKRGLVLVAMGLAAVAAQAAPQPATHSPSQPAAPSPFPDSPGARRAAAFIDAINAGSTEGYERFTREHRTAATLDRATPERRAEQYQQFVRDWGSLRVERVFIEGDVVVVFAETATRGEMLMIRFQTVPGEDSRIDSLRIEPGGSPDLYGIESSPAWTQWTSLSEFLEAVRSDTGVPALAAAVVKDGRIVDSATVGVTRSGGEHAVGPDARFHWGSLTKSVTATAIASLVEKGVLSWDLTVAEALPDAEMLDGYKPITLRQLLSHTAGVQQYTLIDGTMGRRMFAYEGSPTDKRREFAQDLLNESPLFAPGEGFRYSNAGYGLAALMAETVSGIAWEDLVVQAVIEPLGMKTAGLGLPSELSEEEPVGHMGRGPEFRPTMGGVPDLPPIWPAGNIHSDIEDLATYAAMHLAGLRGQDGILRAETIAALHEPAPGTAPPGSPGGYALGWGIEHWPEPGVVSHAHNGSAGTYFATMRLIPEQDLAIVILMNVGGPGDMLAPKIEEAIYNHITAR